MEWLVKNNLRLHEELKKEAKEVEATECAHKHEDDETDNGKRNDVDEESPRKIMKKRRK